MKKVMFFVLAAVITLAMTGCAGLGSSGGTELDRVYIGNQGSESSHQMIVDRSENGVNIENWRHAVDGGYFQYTMKTGGNTNVAVKVRFWAYEVGERTFNIIVEDQKIAEENVVGRFSGESVRQDFYELIYPIPAEILEGKSSIKVKFQGIDEYQIAGGVYGLSLVTIAPPPAPEQAGETAAVQ